MFPEVPVECFIQKDTYCKVRVTDRLVFPSVHSEIKLKVAEMQKQKLEIEEELNRENKKKLEEAMDKAEEEYYKALNDIPGAWGLIGMQVTVAVTHSHTGYLVTL